MSSLIEDSSILNKEQENSLNTEMPSDHDRIEALEKDNIRIRAEQTQFKTEIHASIDKKIMLLIGLTAVNAATTFIGGMLQ